MRGTNETPQWLFLFLASLTLVAFACVWIYLRHSELNRLRPLIESRFSQLIALVEDKSRGLERTRSNEVEYFEYRQAAEKEIGAAIATVPEIVGITWASDNHPHGAHSFKEVPSGISIRRPIIHSQSGDGSHSLSFGQSIGDKTTLVFQGFVPDGEKHLYWIFLRYDQVSQLLCAQPH